MIETLKQLHLTFFSAPFYRQLVTSWKGIGFNFLVIAALLNLASIAINTPFEEIKKNAHYIFANMPEITVADGMLSMTNTSPHMIEVRDEENSDHLKIIFDMNVDQESVDALSTRMRDDKIQILITPTQVLIAQPAQNKPEVRHFKDMDDFSMTHSDWVDTGEKITSYLAPAMAFPVFGVLLLQHLSTAFLGAMFLLLVSMIFKFKTELKNMMRLAAAAKIPVATLSLFVTPALAIQGAIWFGFAMFGLLAARKSQEPLTEKS